MFIRIWDECVANVVLQGLIPLATCVMLMHTHVSLEFKIVMSNFFFDLEFYLEILSFCLFYLLEIRKKKIKFRISYISENAKFYKTKYD